MFLSEICANDCSTFVCDLRKTPDAIQFAKDDAFNNRIV